jgi:protease-4
MSDTPEPHTASASIPNPGPEAPPPYVIPVRYAMPLGPALEAAPQRRGSPWTVFLVLLLGLSIGVNFLLLFVVGLGGLGDWGSTSPTEQYHSGQQSAADKIAVIKVDGVIMESANGFLIKQLDYAARDAAVKAVVLRINSPGGTISGSDDLHRRITELRDGTTPNQKGGKKPVVASMGSLAASGGYYIAMPAEYIFAERTTITGSIGVIAAIPNVAGLAKTYGFGMTVIKAGDVKDSGSMFREMTAPERRVWQEMIDNAYVTFQAVVNEGRKDDKGNSKLKYKLTDIAVEELIPDVDADGKPLADGKKVPYIRRLADGGIYTAPQAKDFGLIDDIGYLEKAIKKAAELARLPGDYKAVTYERPPTLSSLLLGIKAPEPGHQLDWKKLAEGTIPRLWYLAPHSELASILAGMSQD